MIENNKYIDIHDLNDKYLFHNELHYLEDYARHRRFWQKMPFPLYFSSQNQEFNFAFRNTLLCLLNKDKSKY